jgi:hypothetical protein
MLKQLLVAVLVFGGLVVGLKPLSAQVLPPTPDDLTLHPGDSITWTPFAPHKARFGGPDVMHNGKTESLTPFSDVQKVLVLDPALTANGNANTVPPQPAKNLQIVPASGPIWVLKTPQGDKRLTVP